jgi:putative nucleotidyltransferase with HDIG domain
MTPLFAFCPSAPDWRLPWDEMDRAYPFLQALADCPQDPLHHAEGDVWIHTRMVCQELIALPAWRELPLEQRQVVFAAAVLHDVAKPRCTRLEEERITARGHSRQGAMMARNILWRMAVPFSDREQVTAMIRYHQLPFFLIDRPDARRQAIEISQTTRCDHLALLAEADIRGRICADQQRLLDNVALFALLAGDLGCSQTPYPFASDHARVLFFQDMHRQPDSPAHQAFRAEVILMSGLPGSGKDHYIHNHFPDWLLISLDDLREELDVSPDESQGTVINEARERARAWLRQGQSFVWNATNISAQLRQQVIALFFAYQARVRIVYLEVPCAVLFSQNRQRSRCVPEKVMERMIDRWEVPDRTEAHQVDWLVRN